MKRGSAKEGNRAKKSSMFLMRRFLNQVFSSSADEVSLPLGAGRPLRSKVFRNRYGANEDAMRDFRSAITDSCDDRALTCSFPCWSWSS